MAVIVLLFTFGTVVAMGLPIVTAIFGLVCGLSIITLISHVAEVPTVAPTLATMIGLGVGIDYALFIVTRHRAQRRDGMETRESIARATRDLRRRGRVRGLHGDRRAALARRRGHPARDDARLHRRRWWSPSRWPRRSRCCPRCSRSSATGSTACASRSAHAQATTIRTAGGAGASSSPATRCRARSSRSSCSSRSPLPALDLYLGQQDNGALPTDTDARRAYDGLTHGFGAGANGPLLVSVDMSKQPAKPDQAKLDKLSQEQDQKDKAQQKADGRSADRRPARGAGRAARAGPAQAKRRSSRAGQADRGDRVAVGATAQEARADGDRPAAAGPARRTSPRRRASRRSPSRSSTPAARRRCSTSRRRPAPSDRATEDLVDRLRDDTIPTATEGKDMTRQRRRHDRRLRRPRRRDLEPPDHHDRRRRRAQLRAAHARVPLGRDPAHRRADEPRSRSAPRSAS